MNDKFWIVICIILCYAAVCICVQLNGSLISKFINNVMLTQKECFQTAKQGIHTFNLYINNCATLFAFSITKAAI